MVHFSAEAQRQPAMLVFSRCFQDTWKAFTEKETSDLGSVLTFHPVVPCTT